ncbi:effete [Carabus blaptoides fortunei]
MLKLQRLKREIEKLKKEADISGPAETPYADGIFKVTVKFPDKYPFEPPAVKFITKVYHPNIDTEGRICLDLLKMPPSGNWRPSAGIEAILIAVRMLLNYPNPDDPLMVDIADEFRNLREEYERKAREYTQKYAM